MYDKGNNPEFRDIKLNEMECKISTVKETGISLLIYKTARTDIVVLNESVGEMNWKCEYAEINGNMYCGVSIFDKNKNQWVTKWDCGTSPEFGDTSKGEASDAFKRACFKWGIGIELYTSPFIWIPADKCNLKNGKCYDKFSVEKIQIINHSITGISIINKSMENKRVFVWVKNKTI